MRTLFRIIGLTFIILGLLEIPSHSFFFVAIFMTAGFVLFLLANVFKPKKTKQIKQ